MKELVEDEFDVEDVYESKFKPSFENVSKEFINGMMTQFVFNERFANFDFYFKEKEAIDYISKVIKKENGDLLKKLENPNLNNEIRPVMIISNYKEFFELLTQGYKRAIELYYIESINEEWVEKVFRIPSYIMGNYFEYIWLRMKPEDFNHPEEFLKKQVEMMNDTTLDKYEYETFLGSIPSINNHILCIKNGIAERWEECDRQIELTIYDKNYYYDRTLLRKPHCNLPVIRYGIYQKGDKKVCYIGSIQQPTPDLCVTDEDFMEKTNVNKNVNRAKFKVNEGVTEEKKQKVEPMHILALSIFIDILNKEGITEYEVPAMYVLDYEYHEKRCEEIKAEFDKYWSFEESRQKNPEAYKDALNIYKRNYNREDEISYMKTEGLIKKCERILYHYPNSKINSYPGDVDNMLHFSIAPIKNKEEIRGKLLQDIYGIIDEKYKEQER